MLAQLIGGFITIIVGVTLAPSVADLVHRASTNSAGTATNVTGAASTIVDLTTLFFALGVASAGIAIAAQGLKSAGML